MKDIDHLRECAKKIRKDIAWISHNTGRGYLSTAYSSVDILVTLYLSDILNFNKDNASKETRDRFILSKGHAGLALYLVLSELGLIDRKELWDFSGQNCKYALHPVCDVEHGIEMSSGSLGHGLAFAIGQAYAAKMNRIENRIYTLVGDGELQEGSNWEAFLLINALKLENLTIIVDRNNRQITDKVERIVPLGDLNKKLTDFGFDVVEIDGHDIEQIYQAFKKVCNKTKVIIANTIKGKGLSFVEDKDHWHGRGLNNEEWELAKAELQIKEEEYDKCI